MAVARALKQKKELNSRRNVLGGPPPVSSTQSITHTKAGSGNGSSSSFPLISQLNDMNSPPLYTMIREIARASKLSMSIATIVIASCHQLGYYSSADFLRHVKRYPVPKQSSFATSTGFELIVKEIRKYLSGSSLDTAPSESKQLKEGKSSISAAHEPSSVVSSLTSSPSSTSSSLATSRSTESMMVDAQLLLDRVYTHHLAGYVSFNGRDTWCRTGPWQDDIGGGARDVFFEIEFRLPHAGTNGRTSAARGGDLLVHLSTTQQNQQWHTTLIEVLADGSIWGRVWPVTAFQLGSIPLDGQWHQVQMYYDDRRKVTTGWVDGKRCTDMNGNKDTTSNNTAFYCIGPSDNTHMRVNAFYDGDVRRVRIWNAINSSGWYPTTALPGSASLIVDLKADIDTKGFKNACTPQLQPGAPTPHPVWNASSTTVSTEIFDSKDDGNDDNNKSGLDDTTAEDDNHTNWSLADHFRSLVDSSHLSDITLLVDAKPLHAHRLVLIRSAYFRAMLLGRLRESTEKEVTLDDISYNDMKSILRYLYTDSLDIQLIAPEDTLRLYSLADRFQLTKLATHYAAAFGQTLDVDNAEHCLLLTSGPAFTEIRSLVLEYIRNHYEQVWNASNCFEQIAIHDAMLLRDVLRYCTGPAVVAAIRK